MIRRSKPRLIAAVVAAACFGAACSSPALTSFVSRVTTERNPDFVTPAERIAVFDNDGTLWAEQPMYFQLAFALDRVKALAPQHPEWTAQEPFKSVLASDLTGVIAGGEHALLGIVDKAGKPVGIQQVIGRRPTIAFGNSDGDFEMLEWTTTAPGARLGVIIHHTDAEREWAYDRLLNRPARARFGRGRRARMGGSGYGARLGADLSLTPSR